MLRHEIRHADLLAHLAPQGNERLFPPIHMAAYGRIPPSGLDILPRRTFLQVKLPTGVEQMEVHHRMQQHRPAVALAPRGPADDTSGSIDHREQLFPIIRAFHFPTIFYEFYSDRKDCNRRRT